MIARSKVWLRDRPDADETDLRFFVAAIKMEEELYVAFGHGDPRRLERRVAERGKPTHE